MLRWYEWEPTSIIWYEVKSGSFQAFVLVGTWLTEEREIGDGSYFLFPRHSRIQFHDLLVCFVVLLKHRLIPLDYRRISKNSHLAGNFVRSLITSKPWLKGIGSCFEGPHLPSQSPGMSGPTISAIYDIYGCSFPCHKSMPYLCHIFNGCRRL